jgi:3'-phosphoadenosine 5'-phosphosulfate sulfotransferase (PAPS reductase)/FAD synthetase
MVMTEECLDLSFVDTEDSQNELLYHEKGFVCFSGGKDSTAMLLKMLEMNDPVNYPVHRICFADTRFEFQELYDYLSFIDCYIQEKFPGAPKVELLQAKKTWDEWFYGEITRGTNKGMQRAAPLKAYPCWWSREAKVRPLERENKDYGNVYIGIAADEPDRVQVRSEKNKRSLAIRYPLIEWGWTEEDCMHYLDHLGIGNCLYLSFNRIGCYHCPKQSLSSWLEVYENWNDKWQEAKHWDRESIKIRGSGLRMDYTLQELEVKFEAGFKPKKKAQAYDCNTCAAVGLWVEGHLNEEDFDSDNAIERDTQFMESKMAEEYKTADDHWIPPSQRLEWL